MNIEDGLTVTGHLSSHKIAGATGYKRYEVPNSTLKSYLSICRQNPQLLVKFIEAEAARRGLEL